MTPHEDYTVPDKVSVLPRLVLRLLAVVAELLMLLGRRGGLGVDETDELALLSMKFFGSGDSNADDTQRITIIRVPFRVLGFRVF